MPSTITLRRGSDTFHLPPLLWEALQLLAMQEGWKPAGAVDARNGQRYSGYTRNRVVGKRDAEVLAVALQSVVNGKKSDDDCIDLPMVVELVNFLHGGVFEIL